jgi:hypothetical protein
VDQARKLRFLLAQKEEFGGRTHEKVPQSVRAGRCAQHPGEGCVLEVEAFLDSAKPLTGEIALDDNHNVSVRRDRPGGLLAALGMSLPSPRKVLENPVRPDSILCQDFDRYPLRKPRRSMTWIRHPSCGTPPAGVPV